MRIPIFLNERFKNRVATFSSRTGNKTELKWIKDEWEGMLKR